MIRIKICGITNLEDALLASRAGADALGFVFAPSPRRIQPALAAEIIQNLPPLITKVGLFVDEEAHVIENILRLCQLDCLQFHGQESAEFCHRFAKPVIKAFRVKDEKTLHQVNNFRTAAYLFDAYVPGKAGGTGEVFNWDLLRDYPFNAPVILAGGLTPENVLQGIKVVQPYAVDVSSGVEKSAGIKDQIKLLQFINQVRLFQE